MFYNSIVNRLAFVQYNRKNFRQQVLPLSGFSFPEQFRIPVPMSQYLHRYHRHNSHHHLFHSFTDPGFRLQRLLLVHPEFF